MRRAVLALSLAAPALAGDVHVVDPNIMSRPGPRIVEAIETLAAFLYPEALE